MLSRLLSVLLFLGIWFSTFVMEVSSNLAEAIGVASMSVSVGVAPVSLLKQDVSNTSKAMKNIYCSPRRSHTFRVVFRFGGGYKLPIQR